MKTKKILALLFLVAIIAVQGQLVTFAEDPPGVDSPFGDADDDTSPPSLVGGGDDDIPLGMDEGSDYTPPDTDTDADLADDTDADSADDTGAGSADDTDADIGAGAVAGAQDDTPDSENIISESGPGVALLLIPSLILGYAYRRRKKTSK